MGWLDNDTLGSIVNKVQLAELLGVSERTLTDWQAEGMPVHQRGQVGQENGYATAVVIRWAFQRELRRAGAQSSRDRLDEVRARREELALQRDLGDVVMRADIAPAFEAYVAGADAVLTGIPEKYAQTLELTAGVDGKHQVLIDLCDELRTELSDYERCTARAGGGPPPA